MMFLFLLFYLVTVSLSAAEPDLKFYHPLHDKGGDYFSVSSIVQDRNGYMWLGTLAGLYCFNGYELEDFHHNPQDTASLPSDKIQTMFVDSAGNIWIGTHDGLSLFDPVTHEFRNFIASNNSGLSDNLVIAITEDAAGNIWVGTADGLNRLEKDSYEITRYFHDADDPESLPNNVVRSLLMGPGGKLWIGTYGGLSSYDFNSGNFETLSTATPGRGLNANAVMTISLGPEKMLWLGTWATGDEIGGLCVVDPESFQVVRHYPPEQGNLDTRIYTTFWKDNGELWIGTWGGGLFRLNLESGKISNVRKVLGDPFTLSHDIVYSFCADTGGNIWVGTKGGGINLFNPQAQRFSHIRPFPDNSRNNTIHTITTTPEGILWLGTGSSGLIQYGPEGELIERFTNNGEKRNTIAGNIIKAVVYDHFNRLWVGTDTGLSILEAEPGSNPTRYSVSSHSVQIPAKQINAISPDSSGKIWIATYFDGVFVYDFETDDYRQFSTSHNREAGLPSNNVNCFLETSTGHFLIGTTDGLCLYIPDEDRFEVFQDSPESDLLNDVINSLIETRSGQVWAGSNGGGLIRIDLPQDAAHSELKFQHFSEYSGLPDNTLLSIVEDNYGKLWLGTARGLVKFDPLTLTVQEFTRFDGLQADTFTSAAGKDGSGKLYFGGVNGYNQFYPEELIASAFDPPLILESFEIDDQAVELDTLDQLVLHINQKAFSVRFAALDYSAPEEIRYTSYLEGYDDNWVDIGASRNLRYITPPFGKYVLRIKATNADGIWGSHEIVIPFLVVPPFWLRWYFFAAIFVLTIGGVYLLYLRSLQVVKKRAQALEVQVEERTKSVKEANAHLEQLLSEKDLLIKEIHHRVKNNLAIVSSIINLQKDALHSKDDIPMFMQLKSRIHTMALVHEKLYLSENLREIHFREYCQDLFNNILRAYNTDSRYIKVDYNISDFSLDIDMVIPLGLILNELLTNSVKYAFTESGTGNIRFLGTMQNGQLKIIFTDDGSPFPEEFSLETSSTLGIMLIRSLVAQLKGDITVQRDKKEFVLVFPVPE